MNKTFIVETQHGKIRGNETQQGIKEFLGIPYAAPPQETPYHAPKPPKPFIGVFDACSYGATAPQAKTDPLFNQIFPSNQINGDNYLNLNIWTKQIAQKMPVMVFIHGGSFTSGSGSMKGYNGRTYAEKGIVCVTINYRLGIQGFAYTIDGDLNIGLLDQIQALKWIKNNIHSFGGDPENITLFGESAGAMSIGTLLAMPKANGLFHRAILESGAASHSITLDSSKKISQRLGEILNIPMTKESLSKQPIARLIDAQGKIAKELSRNPSISKWGDVAIKGLPFEPIVDNISLLDRPLNSIAVDDTRQILVGFNHEEGNLLFAPRKMMNKVRGWLIYYAAIRYKLPLLETAKMFQAMNPFKKATSEVVQLLTDIVYRVPAIRLANKMPNSYVYEFGWKSPAFNGTFGAAHGVELPFVFNDINAKDWSGIIGDSGNQTLADEVQNAWIQFAKSGSPGWENYQRNNKIKYFGMTRPDNILPKQQIQYIDKTLYML